MLLEMIGVGMICASVYGMWNKLDDHQNKICDYSELSSLTGDGISLSKNIRLSVKQSNNHTLMIAPCESGKSRRFNMPNVNRLSSCSIICTDPSGEIERTCKTNKKKYILNPLSNNSIGYDPLKNCRSEFEVRKIAKVILLNGMKANEDKNKSGSQQDWVGMATPLLTSYMLMNYYTKKYTFSQLVQNICILNIEPVVAERDKDGKPIKLFRSIQQEIFESNIESAIIEFQSFKQVMGASQTLSSIRIVMNSCLQLFLDKNVNKIFEKENIDISKLRTEESIIYIQIPEHHSDYFSPLVATFLTQTFDYYLENDGLQIYYLFDELANIGIIPSFSKLLSTARKHGISINGAIQSLNQLYELYGELSAKALNELFQTLIICGGLRDSANYISEVLGTHEILENETTQTKPLMTADEIRRLDKDRILIICKNKRPVIDRMLDIVA